MNNNSQTKSITQFNPFSGPEIERAIPTTKAQSEILIDCNLGGNNAKRAYNISYSLKFLGTLNFNALENAIKSLIKRHESLRASFSEDASYMCIYSDFDIEISYHDVSTQLEDEKQNSKNSLIDENANYIFDLVNGPLIKISLIKSQELEYLLVLTFHHAICDGLSVDVFLKELGVLYTAYAEDKAPNLPEPKRFSLFAEKENLFVESEDYKNSESFWLDMYKESVPKVELPIDHIRPSIRTYNNDTFYYKLDKNLFDVLKQTGINAGSSIVTTFLSAFELFLYQQTNQNDLVVGLSTSRHAHFNMMGMIGHCVNVLPLRSKIDPNLSFKDYLQQRRTQLFDAYEHQSISFGHLLKKLSIPRDPSRIPLVPVMMNIEFNSDLESTFSFSGLSHELINNHRDYATFEIEVQAHMSKEGPYLRLHYNTSIFKSETIEQMMVSFEKLTEKLVSNPTKSISEVISSGYLDAYNSLNNTEVSYPTEPLHELLSKQGLVNSNGIALEFNESQITYKELYEKSNQLANYLVNQGVKPGDFVGVSLYNSPELVYALIAILQCGGAYIPLDPKYPQSRLEYMLEDSESKFLITNKHLSESFPSSIKHIIIEDVMTNISLLPTKALNINITQDHLAYLLYTSGSTGKPKGVKVTHKNLVNFLSSMAMEPGMNKTDRLLSITTISFDIAGLELFLPLLIGATLILTDSDTTHDPRLLIKQIQNKNITILQATPTTWKMLMDSGWEKPKFLKALCGGEALSIDLAKELASKCDILWNMYGPTETTIWSTIKQIRASDEVITIGKPIANTQIYIINEDGQLLPPGAIGEIGIAGDGVTKGYLKRPELTSEKFIPNSINKSKTNDILYRTGDLGKLLPSGEIQCLGRLDHQVKIRGHRIELGEIEQTFSLIETIKSAVVVGDQDRLVAFVIPTITMDDNTIGENISHWKTFLKDKLPEILVPQDIRIVDEFPVTPNGKLDRQALLKSEALKISPDLEGLSPRNATENLVSNIWKEYLNVSTIDIRSNFFELGGHSLIALQIMNRLQKETGIQLPLSSLFEYSTIEKFSQLLDDDALEKIKSWSSLVPIKPHGTKTPIYIVHGAGMEVLIFSTLAKNLDISQPLYGLQALNLFKSKQYNSIEEIAAHYVDNIIKVNPEGPYALAGYSFGGIIAYEMAKQLKAQGKKINMIGLFDTVIEPHFHYKSPFGKRMASFFHRMNRRATYFREMISTWSNLKYHLNRKMKFVLDYYLKPKTFKTQEEKLKFEHFLETESIIQPIKKRYHLTPEDFEVDLFRAEHETTFTKDPVFLGWKDFALKGVAIHRIPGNHDSMFTPPNDKEIGLIFQKVLDYRNGELSKS